MMRDFPNILAVRLGSLGDVINCFAAVRALRGALAGRCRIVWLAEEAAAPLAAINPDVDEVVILPRRDWSRRLRDPRLWPGLVGEMRRFFRERRAEKFDLLLDFHGNLRSGLAARACGAPRRIGFARGHGREGNFLLMTERVSPPAKRLPRAEKALALARHLAPDARFERAPLRIPGEAREWARNCLASLSAGPFIGMHPGASAFGAFKRWPATRYGQTAALLRDRLNATTLITWGPDERKLAEEAAAAADGAARIAPGTDLPRLAALLEQLALFIAGDTGPLHLAALLNRPVVAIFGPKDPVVYGPYQCPARIVRLELDCSPCARRSCPRPRCMEGITPNMAAEAAVELLKAVGNGGG